MGDYYEIVRRSWGFGLFACLLGSFLSAAYLYISKQVMALDKNVHPIWLATVRQSMTLLLSGPQVAATQAVYLAFSKRVWLLIVVRSLLGMGAIVLSQVAIQRISLTDFATILAITPIVTSIAAWPILGEPVKVSDLPAIFASIAGVLCIIKPDYSTQLRPDAIGYLISVIAVVFQAGLFIVFRKLKDTPVASVNFAFSTLTTPVLIVACIISGQLHWPSCAITLRLLTLFVGISAVSFIILQLIASQILKAKVLSLAPPAELVFQFLLKLIFEFDSNVTNVQPSQAAGAVLVLCAFVYLALKSLITTQARKNDSNKKENLTL